MVRCRWVDLWSPRSSSLSLCVCVCVWGAFPPEKNITFSPLSRHVVLPKDIAKLVPKTHLMTENEWRAIGVQQSRGWVHYMVHQPEPHILLFRRPITKT